MSVQAAVRAASTESGRAARPLLSVRGLCKSYGGRIGCADIGFDLWPGEVMGIVGESGSGKSTLLNCLAGHLAPDAGEVLFDTRERGLADTLAMGEAERRRLGRTDWAFVHQNPRDGLRMGVSAGGNVGERLMAVGARHYGRIRGQALDWLGRVEIDADRIDDRPAAFSGGMQQRLQIARNLVTGPRLVFMDISLPDINGLKLTKKMKESNREVIVVIVTNHDTPEHREAAYEAGADSFISKSSNVATEIQAALRSLAPWVFHN